MVAVRQGKPIHVDRPFVASIGSQSETDAAVDGTSLRLVQADQVAHDDVRARDSPNGGLVQRWQCGGFYIAIEDLIDLDRQQRCRDRNRSGRCAVFGQKPAAGDSEQMFAGIVIVLMSLNVIENRAALAVANNEIGTPSLDAGFSIINWFAEFLSTAGNSAAF